MLQQIGHSLVNSSNTEIQFWGNTPGMIVSAPERVILPEGLIVEGVTPNTQLFNGYRVVERWIESNPTTEIDVKVGETIEHRPDKIVVVYNYELPSVQAMQTHIKAKVANKRWAVEVGGTTINNIPLSTDRESQTKYTAVAVAISQADPQTWSINWKQSNGEFVTLNAQEMMAIINGVMGFVQNCFNVEASFITQIEACTTVEELLAIDINVGWT